MHQVYVGSRDAACLALLVINYFHVIHHKRKILVFGLTVGVSIKKRHVVYGFFIIEECKKLYFA